MPALLEIDPVHARRAIEALRAGVPNQDAVRLLSTQQPHVEARFRRQLGALAEDATAGHPTPGLLVAGDFGAGKSHLLEYLEHLALDERFVCSRVVISKETPLYDLTRVFRAAVESLTIPGKRGSAMAEIASSLNSDSPEHAALSHWVSRPDVGLSSRFAATLFLYHQVKDPEIRDRVVSFWGGDPLNISDTRSWLRDLGERATYRLESVPARDLALQRLLFLARLILAAGYAGWVVLLDEVELIGRYAFKQRARSYAELARWGGKLKSGSVPGLAATFALTSDFDAAVLQDRGDLERVPGKLRASGTDADVKLASQAEQGMRMIVREPLRLRGPDRAMLERTREEVRALHARAFGWNPPDLGAGEQLSTTRIRQYVRRWINEWDLKRLYPDYTPDIVVAELPVDYTERPELEGSGEAAADSEEAG
ncbi:MAG: ATP-binding protein [Chloroflexota bacterium]|nr:ATP-binding protein [Chloroflexota bacterium]